MVDDRFQEFCDLVHEHLVWINSESMTDWPDGGVEQWLQDNNLPHREFTEFFEDAIPVSEVLERAGNGDDILFCTDVTQDVYFPKGQKQWADAFKSKFGPAYY